jgi:uncharacterized membrane protein
MPLRTPLLLSGGIIAAMLALTAWAWIALPADASLPVHWGTSGSPDRYGGKGEALLLVPIVAVAMTGLLAVVPSLEPRREHLAASAGSYYAIWLSLIAFMAVVHAAIVLEVLGVVNAVGRVIPAGVGLLFVVIGLQLRQFQSTYFVGIRTPWTLSSEHSWKVTHNLGGQLFTGLGVVVVVASLLDPPELVVWLILGGVLSVVVTLAVVSYVAWRGDPNRAS